MKIERRCSLPEIVLEEANDEEQSEDEENDQLSMRYSHQRVICRNNTLKLLPKNLMKMMIFLTYPLLMFLKVQTLMIMKEVNQKVKKRNYSHQVRGNHKK